MSELTIPLQLKPTLAKRFTTGAWFLPAFAMNRDSFLTSAMHRIADSGGMNSAVRFRIIGQRNPRVRLFGLLVTGLNNGRPETAIPWIRTGPLYCPADSQFWPKISESEWHALLDSASIKDFAWHPVAGLIGFTEDDLLTAADLLTGPTRPPETHWQPAVPTVRLNDRIQSIQAIVELKFEQMLQDGQDDIGSQDSLKDAPKSPDENRMPGVTDAFRNVGNGLRKLFGGSSSGGKNQSGTGGSFQQPSPKMSARQENELKRLMNLLTTDPDKGLKYALPFGGSAFRGLTNSGDQLVRHDTDFTLGGTGGPAAVWDIPWQYRQQLIQKYSELAAREMQLGRYRRAAYIYSTLLNDDSSAAKSLQQGGFYREAAVIYRDRLKQKQKAAECLRDGGLWHEAIDEFTELGHWQKVAEIYQRIDMPEEAKHAWECAVDQQIRMQNYREAAKLQEDRLSNYQAAATCLKSGWNSKADQPACLHALMELRARHGDHSSASEDLNHLQNTGLGHPEKAARIAEVIAPFHDRYPDQQVRTQAKDVVQRLCAAHLTTSNANLQNSLLKSLRALQPDDRLLIRDCDRYARQTVKATTRSLNDSRPKDMWAATTRQTLSQSVSWRAAAFIGQELISAGYRDNKLVLTRCATHDSAGEPQELQWNLKSLARTPLLLAGRPGMERMFLHQTGGNSIPGLNQTWGQPPLAIQSAPMPASTTQAIYIEQNQAVIQLDINHTSTWLRFFGLDGSLMESFVLPVEVATALEMTTSQTNKTPEIASTSRSLCIGIDQLLITADRKRMGDDSAFEIEEMSDPIVQLQSSPLAMEPQLIVCLKEGAILKSQRSDQPIGFGMVQPKAGWLSPTAFALIDRNGLIETYEVRKQQAELVSSQKSDVKNLLGIFSTHRNRITIFTQDGQMTTFQR